MAPSLRGWHGDSRDWWMRMKKKGRSFRCALSGFCWKNYFAM